MPFTDTKTHSLQLSLFNDYLKLCKAEITIKASTAEMILGRTQAVTDLSSTCFKYVPSQLHLLVFSRSQHRPSKLDVAMKYKITPYNFDSCSFNSYACLLYSTPYLNFVSILTECQQCSNGSSEYL